MLAAARERARGGSAGDESAYSSRGWSSGGAGAAGGGGGGAVGVEGGLALALTTLGLTYFGGLLLLELAYRCRDACLGSNPADDDANDPDDDDEQDAAYNVGGLAFTRGPPPWLALPPPPHGGLLLPLPPQQALMLPPPSMAASTDALSGPAQAQGRRFPYMVPPSRQRGLGWETDTPTPGNRWIGVSDVQVDVLEGGHRPPRSSASGSLNLKDPGTTTRDLGSDFALL
jgi:hypothetical protein